MSGLGTAALVSVLTDRVLAASIRGAPARSSEAWLLTAAMHGALIGVAALVLVSMLELRRVGRASVGRRLVLVVAGFVAFVAWTPVGTAITAGPWISTQAFAPLLRYGVPLGAAAGAMLGFEAGLRWPATRPQRSAHGVTLGLWAVGIGAAALEVVAMAPGRFPPLHLALLATSWLALAAAGLRQVQAPPQLPRVRLAAAALAICILIAGALGWKRISPGLRAELLLHAPTAGVVMRTVGSSNNNYLVELLSAPLPAEPRAPGSADWDAIVPPQTSIILVTIDTLRADALPPLRDDDEHPVAPGDTPFLDQFIAESVAFTNAQAQASATVASMPAMFRSLQAYEHPGILGAPLGAVMAEHGYRSVAVTNAWFADSGPPQVTAMLDGFERVELYTPPETDLAIPWALEMVDQAGERPLFLWLHIFAVHEPGYAGEPLDDDDGSWPQRYRRAVQWVDGEMSALWTGLGTRDLQDKVVVIVASDHGEGLGDNGAKRHGYLAFEEEIHVPLIMRVPGVSAGVVESTVGNIDLVPTIVELAGMPIQPQHRGHSLVPLLRDSQHPWPWAYYVANRSGKVRALVEARTKVIFDAEAGVAMRFDLASDRTEDHNLFTGAPRDRELLFRLLRLNPSGLDGLDDAMTRELLVGRIQEIDASTTNEDLDLLLRLAHAEPTEVASEAVVSAFEAVDDRRVRLRIVQHAFNTDTKAWGKRLKKWLAAKPDPAEIVLGLAAQGQPRFASRWVAGRLRESLKIGLQAAQPWLTLVASWRRIPSKYFAKELAQALRLAYREGDTVAARTAMSAAWHLSRLGRNLEVRSELAATIVPFADHDDASLQVAAVRALGRHPQHSPRLRELIEDPHRDLRVRQAALRALAHLDKAEAIDAIEAASLEPRLFIDAVQALGKLRDTAALSALARIDRRSLSPRDHRRVDHAMRTIRDARRKRSATD